MVDPRFMRDFFLTHLDIFRPGNLTATQRKADGSLVGPGDYAMRDGFLKMIGPHSSLQVLDEETDHVWPPQADHFWLVDPWDGSSNGARGFYPLVGSMVSLFVDAQPVFSCIFVPAEQRDLGRGFYYALKGQGVWVSSPEGIVPLRVSCTKKVADASLLIEGPSRKVAADDRVRRLQQKLPWRINLTCAWAFTRLAAGYADIVVAAHNKPTDTLHGILFAEEAGGKVTDFEGNPPTFENCSNLVYTNGALHAEALNLLVS